MVFNRHRIAFLVLKIHRPAERSLQLDAEAFRDRCFINSSLHLFLHFLFPISIDSTYSSSRARFHVSLIVRLNGLQQPAKVWRKFQTTKDFRYFCRKLNYSRLTMLIGKHQVVSNIRRAYATKSVFPLIPLRRGTNSGKHPRFHAATHGFRLLCLRRVQTGHDPSGKESTPRGGQSADTLQVTQTSCAIGGRRFLYRVDYQAICRHDHTDSSHHEPSHSTTSLTPRRPHSTTPLTPRSPSLHDARFSADSPASWHKFRQTPTFSCCDAWFSTALSASCPDGTRPLWEGKHTPWRAKC